LADLLRARHRHLRPLHPEVEHNVAGTKPEQRGATVRPNLDTTSPTNSSAKLAKSSVVIGGHRLNAVGDHARSIRSPESPPLLSGPMTVPRYRQMQLPPLQEYTPPSQSQ
jgi:hypothetical protein